MSDLQVHESTKIPGLFFIDLDIRGDDRGWFKENYQKEKLETLGLPVLNVVQNNISFNSNRGVTRGIHEEPWDKYISIAAGKAFVAIVDMRKGDNFGAVETFELDYTKAIYVPEGCGNSFQTLETNTIYTYLVNAHWSPDAQYSMVNAGDPELGIEWPIPLNQAIISEKDLSHPPLSEIDPIEVDS